MKRIWVFIVLYFSKFLVAFQIKIFKVQIIQNKDNMLLSRRERLLKAHIPDDTFELKKKQTSARSRLFYGVIESKNILFCHASLENPGKMVLQIQ